MSQEDPLEEEVVTHSSILAWEMTWTDEPGGLQSVGFQRVGHSWAHMHTHMHACIEGEREQSSLFHMKTQWESSYLQARKRVSPGTEVAYTSILDSLACEM